MRHATSRARGWARWLPLAATVILMALALAPDGLALSKGGPSGAARPSGTLAWLEFAIVAAVAVVGGGATIADERRRGTWDAIRLTDWTDLEIAGRKAIGVLARVASVLLLASPSHAICGWRGLASWPQIAAVHAVLIGSGLAMAGLGVLASAWTDRPLHGVALAAAAVLFPWLGGLDWLAGRGIAPATCRGLQPARLLERTLAAPDQGSRITAGPWALFLGFAASVLLAATAGAALGVRRGGEPAPSIRRAGGSRRRARSVGDDPVRWREAHDPGGRRIVLGVSLIAIAAIAGLAGRGWDPRAGDGRFGLSGSANGILLVLTLAPAVAAGLRCAVALVDERTRGTLDLLLMTGRDGSSLVRSKLAAILGPLAATIPLASAFALFAFTGNGRGFLAKEAWLGAGEAALVAATATLATAGPSLFISAISPSSRRALVLGLLLLGWITAGPLVVAIAAPTWLPNAIVQVIAGSAAIYQVSAVGGHGTRFPFPLNPAMLLTSVFLEACLSCILLAAAGLLYARSPAIAHPKTPHQPHPSSQPASS